MVFDSPYQTERLLLSPWAGVLAGLTGAMWMLALLFFSQPLSDLTVSGFLVRIGRVVPGAEKMHEAACFRLGLGIHLSAGGVLGLLYAACQQRAPTKGLVAVGVFYGLVVWVMSGLAVRLFFREALGTFVHTWYWALAHLSYGLWLASVAIWKEKTHIVSVVVPKD